MNKILLLAGIGIIPKHHAQGSKILQDLKREQKERRWQQ